MTRVWPRTPGSTVGSAAPIDMVPDGPDHRKKSILGRQAQMGMGPRLTTVTRQRVSLAKLMYLDAMANDGVVDPVEDRAIQAAFDDSEVASIVADEAGSIAHMVERGAQTPEYVFRRIEALRVAIEALPMTG